MPGTVSKASRSIDSFHSYRVSLKWIQLASMPSSGRNGSTKKPSGMLNSTQFVSGRIRIPAWGDSGLSSLYDCALLGLAEGQLSLLPSPFFSGLFTGDHVQKSSLSSRCGSGGGGEKGRAAEELGRAERERGALLSGKAS